jgi:hypothetical protein
MADIATRLPGPYVYLDIVAQGASFGIYINGEEQNIKTSSMLNCSYDQLGPLLTGSFTNNITVYVDGPLNSARDVGSSDADWSFEFNQFMYVLFLLVSFRWQGANATAALVNSQLAPRARLRVPLRNRPMPPQAIINHRWF